MTHATSRIMALRMYFIYLFCYIFPSSGSPFIDQSEERLLSIFSEVKNNLKIFVYPMPPYVLRCGGSFKHYYRRSFDVELRLPMYIRNSTMYVTDPNVADLYLIDHEWACLMHDDDAEIKHSREAITSYHLVPIMTNIIYNFSFYNRSGGSDHLLICVLDQGPFCGKYVQRYKPDTIKFLSLIENVTIIGNNGIDGKNRLILHAEVDQSHANELIICHRKGKDIVIPQAVDLPYSPTRNKSEVASPAQQRLQRKAVTYFQGGIFPYLDCSPNIRLKLELYHKHIHRKEPAMRDIHLFQRGSFLESTFGLCPAGYACWSARLYHSLAEGCIPVILADPIILPFERFINWSTFSVKYMTNTNPDKDKIDIRAQRYIPPTLGNAIDTVEPLFTHLRYMAANESEAIYKKQESIRMVHRWLSWPFYRNHSAEEDGDEKGDLRSAYSLVMLELWCRTAKGRDHASCLRSVSNVAQRGYY